MGSRKRYSGERAVEPDKKILEEVSKSIEAHLRKIQFGSDLEIKAKIEEIINKAKFGWVNASWNFESRVNQIIGHNHKIHKIEEAEKIIEFEKEKIRRETSLQDLVGPDVPLTVDERRFLRMNLDKYYEEFEFNQSSDRQLLHEVVIDELLLYRYRKQRLKMKNTPPNKSEEEAVNQIHIRYRTNLEKLGLTRNQRLDSDFNKDGNVASLAADLDNKLEEIRKLNDLKTRQKVISEVLQDFSGLSLKDLTEYIDEIRFQQEHELFPSKNNIPEVEKSSILEKAQKMLDE